jgi:hypothetical protein
MCCFGRDLPRGAIAGSVGHKKLGTVALADWPTWDSYAQAPSDLAGHALLQTISVVTRELPGLIDLSRKNIQWN